MNRVTKSIAISTAIAASACTSPGLTRDTLEKSGYTDIETHGWAAMSCEQLHRRATKFTAINPSGIKVDGVVCCGLLLKACTVRF